MNKQLSISIVIPNWNGLELLKKYLPVVLKESRGAEIIVVDDHSSDQSALYLKEHFPYIGLVVKDVHEGFSSAVNAGVKKANGDIVVLLNTDIAPEKGYLDSLVAHFSDPTVFAVGCLDKSHEKGEIILRGRGIGWWEKGFYVHKRGEVDKTDTAWVSGGSGAFRKSIWMELRGMDERFNPFYWEDIDLSYRAKGKGYRVLFDPESVVHHFHEEGKIQGEFTKKDIQYTAFRNQFYFVWKHAPLSQLLLNVIWTPVRMIKDMTRGNSEMFRGFLLALPRLPGILLERI